MKHLSILLIALFSFNNLSAQRYTTKYITDANKVGLQWWNDVNSGQYSKAYQTLSSELQNRWSVDIWSKYISYEMEEFGEVISRTVNETYFTNELDSTIENGFYVVIAYDVIYANTRNHSEELIVKQSDDFMWEIFNFNWSFQNQEPLVEKE